MPKLRGEILLAIWLDDLAYAAITERTELSVVANSIFSPDMAGAD